MGLFGFQQPEREILAQGAGMFSSITSLRLALTLLHPISQLNHTLSSLTHLYVDDDRSKNNFDSQGNSAYLRVVDHLSTVRTHDVLKVPSLSRVTWKSAFHNCAKSLAHIRGFVDNTLIRARYRKYLDQLEIVYTPEGWDDPILSDELRCVARMVIVETRWRDGYHDRTVHYQADAETAGNSEENVSR
ncbi:hypothetical protein EXIGLDRAFT_724262 [Exidia glandulosa HHB12029]|uniref:Uncharacterized protein n=1 Tax=Exidia glandulosa HHB12029 TaxID=1314781 RepID=A0A165MSW9_EXIGL|nr:hypothetical protein EXIGLDRAFT_724262 [Exidia glandulosa HHB12029]